MSLLSALGTVMSPLSNPISAVGSLFDGGDKIINAGDSLGGKFGHSLNLWTGQTDSARQQFQYNLALQKNAQAFAKWQMQNAHQTEVKDLENAGLNPVLSAGGGGASAGVGGASTGAGVQGTNPFEIANSIMQMINSAKTTDATVKEVNSEIQNATKLVDAQVGKIGAETGLINTENKNTQTKTPAMENAENFAKSWWGRNISPVLADIGQIFGGAGAVANAGASITNAKTARTLAKGATETQTFNSRGMHTGTKITKHK